MTMTRRQAAATMMTPAFLRGAANPRPNLVFILIDDLRFNALSCAGHPFLKTPHIDRLAKEGARFTNAFVTTPLCSPSRGSFLTGQWVRTHKVTGNGDNAALSHQMETYPRLLKGAGYETAYVGKWHMGNDDSPRPGFDRWVSFKGQGVYNDPPINVDGQSSKKTGYMTDLLSDYAVEFVNRKRDKPFALYLAHKAVHGPFTPAERHARLFENDRIERLPSAKDTLEGKPALRRETPDPNRARAGGGPADEVIKNQLRCVAAIDEGVGKLLAALEAARQLDNTLVLFTSDNGYFWGEHGLGDKRAAYEESIRIPMVARFPKRIRPGTVISDLVLNTDVAPTMLDLGGASIPKTVQGRSMAPLFGGKAKGWRNGFLCEYFEERNFPRIPSWEAARNKRWKYIHYTGLEGMDELYDLQSDPHEMKNLIAEPAAAKALAAMKAELAGYAKELGA